MTPLRIKRLSFALGMLAAIAVPVASSLNAQETAERAALTLKRVGIGFGFHDLYSARYFRNNLDYAGFADVVVKYPTVLRVHAQYSQTRVSVNSGKFSLKTATLDAIVLAKVTKLSSVGIGIGANWMNFRRHSAVTVFDDPQGNSKHVEVLDLSDALLRPSLVAMASSGWVAVGEAGFELALTYQLTYLGKSFVNRARYYLSSGPLDTIMSLGAAAHITFDLAE